MNWWAMPTKPAKAGCFQLALANFVEGQVEPKNAEPMKFGLTKRLALSIGD